MTLLYMLTYCSYTGSYINTIVLTVVAYGYSLYKLQRYNIGIYRISRIMLLNVR